MSADPGKTEASAVATVTPANPAAGAQWSYVTSGRGLLVSITAVLTTDAVVANRTPRLTITDGGGHTVALTPLPPAQVASLAVSYCWYPGAPLGAVASSPMTAPVPTIELGPGWTIASVTGGMDAGDQWSSIVVAFSQ